MEYVRTATTEYPIEGRLTLHVESRSGNTVVQGQDTDRVTVQIVARIMEETEDAADEIMDRILQGIRHHGDTLTVITPPLSQSPSPWALFGRGSRVDYTITVPHQTACRLTSRSGPIELARVAGPAQIEQRSGRVTVRAIGADVQIANRSGPTEAEDIQGSLSVESRSGKVTARNIGGDARIASHSGGVQVERVAGNAQVGAHSGSVHVERVSGALAAQSLSGRVVAEDVGGDVRIDVKSGGATLTGARGKSSLRTASGGLTFRGPVLADLDVVAASGGVRLEVDPIRPFFIDAETSSGSIHSDLPPRRDGGPPPADAPKVRIRTASGGIRISRYSGILT